jgi:cytochrome c biogenesis protein CcmG/thiol:disulfide interchange protein DsbE
MKPATLGWSVAGVAAALLIYSVTWGLVHAAQKAPKDLAGQPAPDLSIRSLTDGREIRLADQRGRPVVLNFWASWCVPCRQEAPVLNTAARQLDGRVLFLGADIKDSEQPARAYLAEFQVPYLAGPITRGGERDYGVTAPPETYFIDRQGTIVARVTGAIDARRLQLYLSLIET